MGTRTKPLGAPAQKKPVASMARGTSRKPKDNLALDAMDARAAGMTYGKWKAQHPHTKAANEARLAKPKRADQPSVQKVHEGICPVCGEKFTTIVKNKKYCSDDCKAKMEGAKYRARKAQKRAEGGQ